MARNQWAGEATIAAWQNKAGGNGLSLLPHVDSQPLEGGRLVLEVGRPCKLDLRVKNNTKQNVRLLGVFVVPPLSIPGLNWRHCKQGMICANITSLLTATITATSTELAAIAHCW